jgi:23S rRNA (pseudouridine1915-N3)-methyltransferase
MNIQLWTIGKSNETYVDQGVSDFTKRITNYFPTAWKIIPNIKNASSLSPQELKKKESEVVLNAIQPQDYLVLLDEKGKTFTSSQLAGFIQQRANDSLRQLIFLIGGAYGSDDAVLQRANFVWSLSSLTFPHQLVRLILAEQIYRACSIIRNEKYHHT